MPAPNQAEVQAVLSRYNARIRRAVAAGFKSYVRRLGGEPNCMKRTDSADISDCVARALIAEFRTDASVTIIERNGTFKLLFDGKVLVRFKKAGRNGHGMNAVTGAHERFLNPAFPFEDAPNAIKVEICWTLNETATSFETLRVVARNGEGSLWFYELPGAAPLPLFAPDPAAEEEERPRRSVAKLKGAAVRKKERDAS